MTKIKYTLLILITITLTTTDIFGQWQASEWSSWQTFPCWPGLLYSLKRSADENIWKVRFQNTYSTTVNFDFKLILSENYNQYSGLPHADGE